MDCCADTRCCSDSPVRSMQTTGKLTFLDRLGAVAVRLGIKRDDYKVTPGLYRLGEPNSESPVLVTANYKLTFDTLRSAMEGHNLWLLVLDTKGINVWCAAGKGSFGTGEVVARVWAAGLTKILSHRTLILPQLAAPGVAAHEVTKNTGFRVVYGPVGAKDIPRFLARGMVATSSMRRVTFTLGERLVVSPIEVVQGLKLLPPIYGILFLANILGGMALKSFALAGLNMLPILAAWLIGSLAVPILLPVLPFASFALNGALLGLVPVAISMIWPDQFALVGLFPILGVSILSLTLTSFLSLNFTGATPITSLSGVKVETELALPTYKTAVGVAIFLILFGNLLAGGVS